MNHLFLLLGVSISVNCNAAEDKINEKKDFSVICAISKSAEALSKDKYMTDKAERVVLISGMLEKNVKTDEVKSVLKAIATSEPSQKVKLMRQGARDVGLKNWNCATIKFLF